MGPFGQAWLQASVFPISCPFWRVVGHWHAPGCPDSPVPSLNSRVPSSLPPPLIDIIPKP
eukprot:1160452-Pelagomonas_calceolata.AAC.7